MRTSSALRVQNILHDVQAAIEVRPILACSSIKQRCAFLSALRADMIAHKNELTRANRHDCEAFTQQLQTMAPLAPSPSMNASPMAKGDALRGSATAAAAAAAAAAADHASGPAPHGAVEERQGSGRRGSTAPFPQSSSSSSHDAAPHSSLSSPHLNHFESRIVAETGDDSTAARIGEVLGPFYQSAFTSRPSHRQQLFPLRFDKLFPIIDYLLEQPDPISIPQDCWLRAFHMPDEWRAPQGLSTPSSCPHFGSSSSFSPATAQSLSLSTDASAPSQTSVHANADSQIEVCEIRVPLGLVGFLSRYRPRMLLDATAMGVFAGNAVLVDGGASLHYTNATLMGSVRRALLAVGLPGTSVVNVESYDTHSRLTAEWLHMSDRVDMGLVCGPPKLYEFACRNSSIPLIRATSRASSLFVDESASYDTAVQVILNAKGQSLGAANAITTLIINAQFPRYVELLHDLVEHGVTLLGDYASRERVPECISEIATDEEYRGLTQGLRDFSQTLCVKTVDNLDQALFFLDLFGSKQSDGIIATDECAIANFCHHVDSAVVLVNASTRLSSGAPLGCGPDLAMATSKVHCRGPFTLSALTTRKFIVRAKSECGALRN